MIDPKSIVASFRNSNEVKESFDPDQLKMGIEVEKEHKDLYDFLVKTFPKLDMTLEEFATWIAKAHLREFKDYYTRLKTMEAK